MSTGLNVGGVTGGLQALNSPLMKDIVENVRFFMRDFAGLNRLTKGLDHSDRHIAWAVLDTLSDWASTPPFIGQNLEMILFSNWQSIFIRGVAISLLESLHFLHMRNFLPYSDGGVNVQTENPQMIEAALQMMKNEYEQKKLKALIAQNIAASLQTPGVHSEYLFVNSFWGTL